jgi:hypothetical protein
VGRWKTSKSKTEYRVREERGRGIREKCNYSQKEK